MEKPKNLQNNSKNRKSQASRGLLPPPPPSPGLGGGTVVIWKLFFCEGFVFVFFIAKLGFFLGFI
jgi:hypothetical protein